MENKSKGSALQTILLIISLIAVAILGVMVVKLQAGKRELTQSVQTLEKEISDLKGVNHTYSASLKELEQRIDELENKK